jgi:hypothetical protein
LLLVEYAKNLRRIQTTAGARPVKRRVRRSRPLDGRYQPSFKDDRTYLVHEVNVSDKVRENLTPDGQPRESLVGLDPAPSSTQSRFQGVPISPQSAS